MAIVRPANSPATLGFLRFGCGFRLFLASRQEPYRFIGTFWRVLRFACRLLCRAWYLVVSVPIYKPIIARYCIFVKGFDKQYGNI